MNTIRRLFYPLSYLIVLLLKPIKLYAYRTRFEFIKRLILAFTIPIDFALIWMNVQNETMVLHWKVYKGNFLFGNGVMVTDHATTAAEIAQPVVRGNNFMGVDIVASQSAVFATNAPILNQCPPIRSSTRNYLDTHIFTPDVLAFDDATVRARLAEILDEWKQHPQMSNMWVLRSACTRVFLKLLSGKTISVADAESATKIYIRRFVEFSLFGRYFPFIIDVLGSHKSIRRDAYFKLKAYGIDTMVIDITLFAAMFSIGTLLMRCVEDVRRFGIRYPELSPEHKRRFVFEVLRLYPTVTSVHRILEQPEFIRVGKRDILLTPGDEVVYPFICSNRDERAFASPERIDLDRPAEHYDRVLSWSKGPHSCPAKEMSILVTVAMLDAMAERYPLDQLKIPNLTF
jgi:hypothetical protein